MGSGEGTRPTGGGPMAERTLEEQIDKYLTDVHSIEVQALAQMEAAPDIAGDDELAEIFRQHLVETRDQERLVRAQLEARGVDTSALKDIAGRVGGWAMVAFAKLNPDTPGKLVAHGFSYEHLELAAYELLARVARRAGDEEVAEMAERIGAQERAMAERLAAGFDRAVDASLREKRAAGNLEDELVSYLTDVHAIEAQAVTLLEKGPGLVDFEPLARAFEDHLQETHEQQRMVDARLGAHDASPSVILDAALRLG